MDHPKHVFVTDLTFWVSVVFGVANAVGKAVGKKTFTKKGADYTKYSIFVGNPTNAADLSTNAGLGGSIFAGDASLTFTADEVNDQINQIVAAFTGVDNTENALSGANASSASANALSGSTGVTNKGIDISYTGKRTLPLFLKTILNVPTFNSDVVLLKVLMHY
jgi:hypothetical protein